MWTHRYPVRPDDIDDALGHLTATAYLGLFEENRAEWMKEVLGYADPPYAVATQQIDYLHEITAEDGHVIVGLGVAAVGTTSLQVAETLSTSEHLCARSRATLVMWDTEGRGSRPVTPRERAVFDAYAAEVRS
jgi:acyl-CoA thioester hydrolase